MKRKIFGMFLVLTIVTTVGMSATQVNVSGGTWTYGTTSNTVYSKYYHKTQRHYSSVVNYDGQYERGNANKGGTSRAELPQRKGQSDSAYYGFY